MKGGGGIVKLKDAKGNFILWPRKDIIIKTHSSPIVSMQSREDECTPTSQNTIHSTIVFTAPSLHNLLSIILVILPLFEIHELNKLLSNVLLHKFIL
jgi:hypothetical protein